MSRSRLPLLVALAMLVLGAVTATAAQANEFIVEEEAVTKGVTLEGSIGVSKLREPGLTIECKKNTFAGELEGAGVSKATLRLKECTGTDKACTLPETIEFKLKNQLVGEAPQEEDSAANGSFISQFTVGGPCEEAETAQLTGTQTCELPEAKQLQTEHEVVCSESGSNLFIGGVFAKYPATFQTTEKLELASGKKWRVKSALPPPRIEQVDFTNDENVLIDHTKPASRVKLEKKEEAPQAASAITSINELSEGEATADWQAPKGGEVKKNWPVAFVKGTKPKLMVRFSLEKPTEEFIEKRLEGAAIVTGEGTVGGAAFKFKAELTKAELEATKGKGYFATKEIEAETALPNKVQYQSVTITWKWRLKEKAKPPFEQGLGGSTHNLYLMYEGATGAIYFTLLAQDTEEIGKEAPEPTEEQVVAGVWNDFSNGAGAPANLHYWMYAPGSGVLTKGSESMGYYQEILGKEFKQVRKEEKAAFAKGIQTTAQLLENLDGECGAWQKALDSALETEGIERAKIVNRKIEPTTGTQMLVKNWELPETVGSFPNKETQVKKQAGVAGQGVATPSAFFLNHQIVEVEVEKKEKELYDPSYGIGPVEGKEEERRLKYQEKSIAGFCKEEGEWKCQRAEKKLELKFK